MAIDGKQIECITAVNTFVEALEIMGLDRVLTLGKKLSGIPLISKVRPTKYQTFKQLGSLYICTHSSTKDMKRLLDELGVALNLSIQVKIL
ncbi:MAG: hypothetical protein HFP77_02935 [Methylococcales symbiont of Iophon sp. n. MRB-2018]|nr:MAG: hypothetical protein HFP77_02935 [Methylococcales symbiont of Iophon sp. n. MRB-2018]KAF3980053.1 MAG: hypothetical protein HFP76_03960 [Methylococcales symbiont of Iophon sp. n. MRB-2018]